ncbi:hypothetical protein SUGI_0461930 [Cryptomeria japonica]|uniref:uncharacterized protein LOC131051210 n=1 Tax=Cryptomeria japonica TaxID=3369 RepID=UPI002408A22D|nr:uncharacterized protein LOC131051210 [Cryptomeria japonica]XP_057841600.2 uncharacterized protein LOC131051210 [Cryptomeria japonica]GLJ24224.1 hypothetical protein SUGI_0461930 [Cryptomeria japonica]
MEMPSTETQIPATPATPAINCQNSASKPGKKSFFTSDTSMRGRDRRALVDVTNDSPIAGLALDRGDGSETPVSNIKFRPPRESVQQTPGTGEALLRYQVKSLLQRVDKPAPSLRTLSHLNGLLASPNRLLAPTPANTPDSAVAFASNSSLSRTSDSTIALYVDLGMSSPGSESKIESSVNVSGFTLTKVIDPIESPQDTSPEKPTTRALLFDSPEKEIEASISSPSSVISSEDSQKMRIMEDDNVSEWSVQVNISSPGSNQTDDYAQIEIELEDQVDYSETVNNEVDEEDDEQKDGEVLDDEQCDELCRGLNKVSVHDNGGIPAFAGKHSRFVYNSDDELESEVVVSELQPSPSKLRLKGMLTPKGKHIRFSEEDDSSENTSN